MALKIRLRQQGRRNSQVYRLVVTDARSPRDGKYIEMLGWYDPHRAEENAHVEPARVTHWLDHGAILTESAANLLKRVAPTVLSQWQQKQLAAKAKICAKKRTTRKKEEAITV